MIDKWLKAGILEAVTRRLRAMGLRDKPIVPRYRGGTTLPRRLIGTIRRECVQRFHCGTEARKLY
jgi:hypothetical protein